MALSEQDADAVTVHNYGSINIDHVYRVPHLVRPGETLSSTDYRIVLGGKGANQSLALARAGGRVDHWGQLGDSDRWALDSLREAGVGTEHIALMAGASGHTVIQVDDAGENAIVLFGGTNQRFEPARLAQLVDDAEHGNWLLLQNECNATADLIERALEHGLKVAFNPAPMTREVQELPLDDLSLLFVNRGEAAGLVDRGETTNARALAEALHERLPETDIVLTLGGDGAWFIAANSGETHHQPARPAEVVDTTGAGDTFIGYYMAALQRGGDVATCLVRATAAAALAVQRPGAATSIPTVDEVEALLGTS